MWKEEHRNKPAKLLILSVGEFLRVIENVCKREVLNGKLLEQN